jgi:hypothetical protein
MASLCDFTIYPDDHYDGDYFIALLRRSGFQVVSPRSVSMRGQSDEVHLTYCAQNGYVILTANAKDFRRLHEEWQSQGKTHSGIIAVYYEHDASKNMSLTDIVSALKKLLKAHQQLGLPIANEFIVLNHWR